MGLRSFIINQLDLSLGVVVRGVGRIGLNEVGCGRVWEVVGVGDLCLHEGVGKGAGVED